MYLTAKDMKVCQDDLFCSRLDWDDDNWDENGKQITKPFCCERGDTKECLHQYRWNEKGLKSPYERLYGKPS